MFSNGWKTITLYLLLLVAAILLCHFSQPTHFILAYSLILLLCVLVIVLHRMASQFLENYQTASLNKKRLETKAWYFESVIANSGNIIFTTDIDHRILKFNRGSEKTFLQLQTEALGKEVFTLFEKPDEIKSLLEKVEKEGFAEIPELQITRPGSEKIWISVSISRMYNREQQIMGEVFNCANITQRKLLEEQLQIKNDQLLHLSITDGLTGLFNIRHLHQELEKLTKTLKRFPDRKLSLALIDVDHFKDYNDSKGHQAGDLLLIQLSNIFTTTLRLDLDSAYRYGGDEFVLLLPDTNAEGAQVICERILSVYRKEQNAPTSLSIGIAQFSEVEISKDNGKMVKDFIEQADAAMYKIKCAGGDGVRVV